MGWVEWVVIAVVVVWWVCGQKSVKQRFRSWFFRNAVNDYWVRRCVLESVYVRVEAGGEVIAYGSYINLYNRGIFHGGAGYENGVQVLVVNLDLKS